MLILREGAYAMEQRERVAHGHERPGIAAAGRPRGAGALSMSPGHPARSSGY
jgi:hypothetical protein